MMKLTRNNGYKFGKLRPYAEIISKRFFWYDNLRLVWHRHNDHEFYAGRLYNNSERYSCPNLQNSHLHYKLFKYYLQNKINLETEKILLNLHNIVHF